MLYREYDTMHNEWHKPNISISNISSWGQFFSLSNISRGETKLLDSYIHNKAFTT